MTSIHEVIMPPRIGIFVTSEDTLLSCIETIELIRSVFDDRSIGNECT